MKAKVMIMLFKIRKSSEKRKLTFILALVQMGWLPQLLCQVLMLPFG
jgi:hypothetical protein